MKYIDDIDIEDYMTIEELTDLLRELQNQEGATHVRIYYCGQYGHLGVFKLP